MSLNNEDHQVPVPLPKAYTRQLSYESPKSQSCDPKVYVDEKHDSVESLSTEVGSLKEDKEVEVSGGKRQKSVLIFLRDSRIYIRILAILIMSAALSLVLTAIILYAKAPQAATQPLNPTSKPAPITDFPCKVFSGVAAMNLVFSVVTVTLSCTSSKFRKSNQLLNSVFTITSAIGFASSMSACSFLNKKSTLQKDLWKWSCGNYEKGIVSDTLDYALVCNVVSFGWRFGVVQASLELLTLFISISAFILLKYSYFIRYGAVGKIF